MIEVILNDRLGKKVRVKCNEDDTIGELKLLVAAQTGTRAEKIRIQKWYTVYKDHISLADYEVHDGMSLEFSLEDIMTEGGFTLVTKGGKRLKPGKSVTLSRSLTECLDALNETNISTPLSQILDFIKWIAPGNIFIEALGLGSFSSSLNTIPLTQLKLLLELKNSLNANTFAYDPVFTIDDKKLLKKCAIWIDNSECGDVKPQDELHIFFYLHCPKFLYKEAIEKISKDPHRYMMIGNNLGNYADKEFEDFLTKLDHTKKLLSHSKPGLENTYIMRFAKKREVI